MPLIIMYKPIQLLNKQQLALGANLCAQARLVSNVFGGYVKFKL